MSKTITNKFIRNITPSEVSKNELIFNRIFRTIDTFDNNLFSVEIDQCFLLCPTEQLWLSREQYDSLILLLKEFGEISFFVSEISRNCFCLTQNELEYKCQHWECSVLCNYSDYTSLGLLLENVIYSSTGKWGIIISNEWSGAFGGKTNYTETFKRYYSNWQKDITIFKQEWNNRVTLYKSDISWIDAFLQQFTK
jgi:hypothetical protein